MRHFNLASLLTLVSLRVPLFVTAVQELMCIGYTPWINTLDYTSVVFPVTQVDKATDTFDLNYQPLNESDKTISDQCESSLIEGMSTGYQPIFAKTTLKFSKAHPWGCNWSDGDSKKKRSLDW